MKRTPMLRKTSLRSKPPAPVKRERPPLVLVPRLEPTRAVMVLAKPEPAKAVLKTPERKSQAIRDSARDEHCTVRIIGACNHRTDTTVLSHLPSLDGGRGMGMKAIDEASAYACAACHDVVDGRAPLPAGATADSVLLDWHRGHIRTLVIWKQKGLL